MRIIRPYTGPNWSRRENQDFEEVELCEAIKKDVIDHSTADPEDRLPFAINRLTKLVSKLAEKLIEHNLLTLEDLNEINYTNLKMVGDEPHAAD